MIEQIVQILCVAAVASLIAPMMMLVLARLGYFEPIELRLFGRSRILAPPRASTSTSSNSSSGFFGPAAAAMPAVLTVIVPLQLPMSQSARMTLVTYEAVTSTSAVARARDIECDWS